MTKIKTALRHPTSAAASSWGALRAGTPPPPHGRSAPGPLPGALPALPGGSQARSERDGRDGQRLLLGTCRGSSGTGRDRAAAREERDPGPLRPHPPRPHLAAPPSGRGGNDVRGGGSANGRGAADEAPPPRAARSQWGGAERSRSGRAPAPPCRSAAAAAAPPRAPSRPAPRAASGRYGNAQPPPRAPSPWRHGEPRSVWRHAAPRSHPAEPGHDRF